jgi:hypothetical protein
VHIANGYYNPCDCVHPATDLQAAIARDGKAMASSSSAALAQQQGQMDPAADLLRLTFYANGGVILYSTCPGQVDEHLSQVSKYGSS